LRSGEKTVPFFTVPRSTYQLGCWVEPQSLAEAGVTQSLKPAWWLFTDEDNAVALELDTGEVAAWFWDGDRDCLVRVAALQRVTLQDATPPEYYKADDAMIAFRFKSSTQTGLSVEGKVIADIVGLEGQEQLIVESDEIAIHSADGRALLRETFPVEPDWPCYTAQLTVFLEADGGKYAITSFETAGERTNCSAPRGDIRYHSTISDWRPETQQFEQTYRVLDTLSPLDPAGEDARIEVTRRFPIPGGQLETGWRTASRYVQDFSPRCVDRDLGSGVCLREEDCGSWSSSQDRTVTYTLVTPTGARIDVGTATSAVREVGDDCDGSKGP
jgi:hypothetical protein